MKISSNYSEFRNGPESCAFMVQNIYNLFEFHAEALPARGFGREVCNENLEPHAC
jgi:hypothetical protein